MALPAKKRTQTEKSKKRYGRIKGISVKKLMRSRAFVTENSDCSPSALEHPFTPTLIEDIVRKDGHKEVIIQQVLFTVKLIDLQAVIRRASANCRTMLGY